jgi:hypothetical protein
MSKEAVNKLISPQGMNEFATRPEKIVVVNRNQTIPNLDRLDDFGRLKLAKLYGLEHTIQRAYEISHSSKSSERRKAKHRHKARQADEDFINGLKEFADLYLLEPNLRQDKREARLVSRAGWRKYISRTMRQARKA